MPRLVPAVAASIAVVVGTAMLINNIFAMVAAGVLYSSRVVNYNFTTGMWIEMATAGCGSALLVALRVSDKWRDGVWRCQFAGMSFFGLFWALQIAGVSLHRFLLSLEPRHYPYPAFFDVCMWAGTFFIILTVPVLIWACVLHVYGKVQAHQGEQHERQD